MTARARLALATMALLALVAFVYSPVYRGVFVWDDHSLVETNALVEHGTASEIFRKPYWTANPLSDVRAVYYRPLTMLSLHADFAVAGAEAPAFHITNVLLHLLATIVLLLVARRLGATPEASAIAAAIWALHPRSTESVAWISGRTDVLAALLAIAAVGLWPWYADVTTGDAAATNPKSEARARWRAGGAALALLLGLLAKEVAIAAVPAIAAATLIGTSGPRRLSRVAQRLTWLGAALAIYVALRWNATHGGAAKLTPMTTAARGATILEAVGRYAAMIVDPWHPATSIGLVGELDRGRAALGGVVLLACVVLVVRAVVRMRRRKNASSVTSEPSESASRAGVIAGLVLGASALGLVIHIIPIALASGVTADRLLYLPLAGLALALAVASAKLSPRGRRIAGAAALVLAATFVPITHARARDYANELQFRVVAAEQAHPLNTSPKSGLATDLRAAGELELSCKLHASVRRTLERTGRTGSQRYTRALENLAGCLAVTGDYGGAAAVYADLEAAAPTNARVQMEIGFLHLHRYELDEAEGAFAKAYQLDPALELARHSLVELPAIRARVKHFTTDESRDADPIGWARILTQVGRVPDAIDAWRPIVLDARTPPKVAWEGLAFLFANADITTVRSAAASYMARNAGPLFMCRDKLAKRNDAQARIDVLRPRIEALAEN